METIKEQVQTMELIKNRIQMSIDIKQQIVEDAELLLKIDKASEIITHSLLNKKHIYFAGNGGSAADAQHLAAELSGKFYLNRRALAAEALHCNSSYLTAVANDFSFSQVYSRLISGIGKEGDCVLGISTSGNSENLVNLFETSRAMDIHCIALTGKNGGKLLPLSDLCISIPSIDTPRIQEAHITIGHIICEIVEKNIFS